MMLLIGKLQVLFILLPISKGELFSDDTSSEMLDSVSFSNEQYLREARTKTHAQIGESKCTCVCKRCKMKHSNRTKKCCKCTNCDGDTRHRPNDEGMGYPGDTQNLLLVPFPMPYPVPVLIAPVSNASEPEQENLPEDVTQTNHSITEEHTTPLPHTTPAPHTTSKPHPTVTEVTNVSKTTKQAIRSRDIKQNLDVYCNEYGNCFKSFSRPFKTTKGVKDLKRRKLEISYNIRPTISVDNIRVPMGKRYGLIELPDGVAQNLRPTRKQKN